MLDVSEPKAGWEKGKDQPGYQHYGNAFTQFNNHFHLDEKDGGYRLSPVPVELMLLISKPDAGEFAVIERVFADVDNAKARCFIKTYSGVRTKALPVVPFVFQMSMGQASPQLPPCCSLLKGRPVFDVEVALS